MTYEVTLSAIPLVLNFSEDIMPLSLTKQSIVSCAGNVHSGIECDNCQVTSLHFHIGMLFFKIQVKFRGLLSIQAANGL
ncbi:hypothetical protein AQUCO_00800257v1 [Aquilegia coerulea]|uniref:Uncharacterized protein n=1 Tax=Aquilegia coerulea TaxID=218851 RepID=A0A2G5EHX5_AQUCA|nr:hypothetical protein AQUCO_00800257v1 [Aquilegia coerulea]